MDGSQFSPMVGFIWSIADLLRDHYKRGKYRDVILPMTLICRLDCLLEPTKAKVLARKEQHKGLNPEGLTRLLCDVSGFGFYNDSNFTLKELLNNPAEIKENFKDYLYGFSPNVRDILKKFKFETQLDILAGSNILYRLVQEFCSEKVNFSIHDKKDKQGRVIQKGLSNLGMGYVFEELIRQFNEENNEEAGEHFTPREVIRLMAELVFRPVQAQIQSGIFTIYDNACGSGGMLTESKAFLKDELQSRATFELCGQEVNDETYALCKADMLIKGENPENIKFGSTLSQDGFKHQKFDFMLTNPPFGKAWGSEQRSAKEDARFNIGVTGAGDGQMMFLLNMLSKMKDTPQGSRIACVHNGSPLFNEDGGQVAIRSHIIKNDFLEALIALPTDLFYNTGIPTFIWILSNRKPTHKQGKVQLIDATSLYAPMAKSLGQKRNRLNPKHINHIVKLFLEWPKDPHSVILDKEDLGYLKFSLLSLKPSAALLEEQGFHDLENKEEILKKLQELERAPKKLEPLYQGPKEFLDSLGLPMPKIKGKKTSKSAFNVLFDKQEEKICLKEDIKSYFFKNIWPHTPLSFMQENTKKEGYEILFNQFFKSTSKGLGTKALKVEICALEIEISTLLEDIFKAMPWRA
ncbi:type I restriction-modification system subunit M [Helicobacter heilmannii]|uniref:type I restriction-modification system subunit M n=2 Tax=Helicobacter heilmannii TaxID=35817 RepID=UPI0006A01F86|nr:class I SAM-dependent DNA methyltransferase [Helicobacter heilmannii]CRF46074.1 Type I restriction-modification system, DNA-methyltransferase subunit M [Helicobacter heilmannii]